jgi:hypothetical protein
MTRSREFSTAKPFRNYDRVPCLNDICVHLRLDSAGLRILSLFLQARQQNDSSMAGRTG